MINSMSVCIPLFLAPCAPNIHMHLLVLMEGNGMMWVNQSVKCFCFRSSPSQMTSKMFFVEESDCLLVPVTGFEGLFVTVKVVRALVFFLCSPTAKRIKSLVDAGFHLMNIVLGLVACNGFKVSTCKPKPLVSDAVINVSQGNSVFLAVENHMGVAAKKL